MAKRKRNNRNFHQNPQAPPERNMAPQAAAHKRGGTHRVRDADRTNTIFDEWDYKQLKAECIERKVYVKDMKKVEMARTLANNERERKQKERDAIIERANKQLQLAKEKQREDDRRLKEAAAKTRRRLAKQARRERDESVSEDTPDEEELKMMHNELMGRDADDAGQAQLGQALSEDSWDSTSTETTFRSKDPPIVPDCRLTLFEWPYPTMPSPVAPPSPFSPVRTPGGSTLLAPITRVPRKIPYISLKVHTINSKEKLFLPGQTYPPGVDPDYVPILSPRTRIAARNGHLTGVLRKATIEPASVWANRTQIQGWNARMFFSLPSRNEKKMLQDVYNKWYLENRKLLRVKPTDSKADRERRHQQREGNKKHKLADVLDASEWRPLTVCYLPAYLDYGERDGEQENSSENLWYVRFPGCDVPHYYFWTRHGDWENPAVPNPAWNERQEQQDDKEEDEDHVMLKDGTRVSQKRVPEPPQPVHKTTVRMENSSIPSPPPPLASTPSFSAIVSHIEHQLYATGLAATLSFYRMKWSGNGKINVWKLFARNLPLLYPSGNFPAVPPVSPRGAVSVATKIASLEMLGAKTLLSPFTGDEAWTSDDDARWEVVEVKVDDGDHGGEQQNAHQDELEALYRRGSVQLPSRLSTAACAAWLETVSPSFAPLTPGTVPASPDFDIDPTIREEWERQFLQPTPRGMDLTCPFCLAPLGYLSFEAQASHMYAHSAIAPSVRRRPSLVFSRVALPPAARRPSCLGLSRKQSTYDIGAEGDIEETPSRRLSRKKIITKTRRVSQQTYIPPATPSSHIPSPYLPTFRLYPAGHPNAAWDPRKASMSSMESLEFLNAVTEVKKRPRVNVRIERSQKDGNTPIRFNALDRRSSKPVEPDYPDLPTLSSRADAATTQQRRIPGDMMYSELSTTNTRPNSVVAARATAKKRKRTIDPTYRDRPVSDDEHLATPSLPPRQREPARKPAKKRKKLSDPTYRDYFSSTTASETDDAAPLRNCVNATPKGRTLVKKRKVADPSFRHRVDLSSDFGDDVDAPRAKRVKRTQAVHVAPAPRRLAKRDDVKRGNHLGLESRKEMQGASEAKSGKQFGVAYPAARVAIAQGRWRQGQDEGDASGVVDREQGRVRNVSVADSEMSKEGEAEESGRWCRVM